jgi:hypothetical protein
MRRKMIKRADEILSPARLACLTVEFPKTYPRISGRNINIAMPYLDSSK